MDDARAQGSEGFLLRGHVVEPAVAVVIGAASTAVVRQFVDSFLTPLVGLAGGSGQLGGTFEVEVDGRVSTWGASVGRLVTFVLTAAVVDFVVVLPVAGGGRGSSSER